MNPFRTTTSIGKVGKSFVTVRGFGDFWSDSVYLGDTEDFHFLNLPPSTLTTLALLSTPVPI